MAARFGQVAYAKLSGDALVAALVATRIYPGYAPQGVAMPCIVYQIISDVPTLSLSGYTSTLRNATLQVDCYARSYDGAQALADAVVLVLGALLGSTSSSLASRRDQFGDNAGLFRVSLDFSLWSNDT